MLLCAGLLHWTQSRSSDAGKETRRQTWQTWKPFERPEGENWVRNRVPMEIRCKGVPKFNCTFLFDTDEYCDQVINMKATQCNHRKDVSKCPITLNTKLGCELKTTITNKGAKILVSPKIEISGGATRPAGFMDSCVCITEETTRARAFGF